MKKQRVFQGRHYRVQMKVYDWRESVAHYRKIGWDEQAAELEARGITYVVACLKQTAHPSTAFAIAGFQVYHGVQFSEAWQAVRSYTMNEALPVPSDWRGYAAE